MTTYTLFIQALRFMQPLRCLADSLRRSSLSLLLALFCASTQAAEPALFALEYDGRYGSWSAESVRTLTQEEANGVYHLQAQSKILLLGKSVSTITEDSTFTLQDDLPLTSRYSFVQTGIGARTRSVNFDRAAGVARYQVKDKRGDVALQGQVHDELTSFLVLRRHLEQGEQDIVFDVLDRDHIETHHYRVLDQGPLHTALGDFDAVHVSRLREEGNARKTEFWLARDYDYVLLKLEQSEPDGSNIGLDITGGTVNGMSLQALQESHLGELQDNSLAP
jgi:hypothetical protein